MWPFSSHHSASKPKTADVSQQQKIVDKYDLQSMLDANSANDRENGNIGCHQPLAHGPENDAYKDFRMLAERAKEPAALLEICSQLSGLPSDVISAYSQVDTKLTRITDSSLSLPKDELAEVLGHELTHTKNKDQYINPLTTPAVKNYTAFENAVAVPLLLNARQGRIFSPSEIQTLATQEATLQQKAQNAFQGAIDINHQSELTSDNGGVILAAGPSCKIHPEAMAAGIEKAIQSLPGWAKEASITHPSLEERKANLQNNTADLHQACIDYYHPAPAAKQSKTPTR